MSSRRATPARGHSCRSSSSGAPEPTAVFGSVAQAGVVSEQAAAFGQPPQEVKPAFGQALQPPGQDGRPAFGQEAQPSFGQAGAPESTAVFGGVSQPEQAFGQSAATA